MSITNAADLATALKAVQPGATITLGDGKFGDLSLSKRQGLTFAAAEGTHPVFDSLTLLGCSDIICGAGITFALPYVDGKTITSTKCVRISGCQRISMDGCSVSGAMVPDGAVNAVPQSATTLKAGGNVIGLGAGNAVWVGDGSSVVSITHCDIGQAMRAIVLSGVSGITITGNDIHDIRCGMVDGNVLADTLISGNHLFGACPWNWGAGDHADFIHLWTTADQVSPTTNTRILDNLCEQAAGIAILGIYLDTNYQLTPARPGFSGGEIARNVISCANSQALRLENCTDFNVHDDQYLAPDPTTVEARKLPQIVLRAAFVGQISNVRALTASWDQSPLGWLDALAKLNPFGASTADENATAVKAWLAKFRAPPAPPKPVFDAAAAVAAIEAEIAALKAQLGIAA